MAEGRIVAVGLLTRADVAKLGPGFKRIWPVDQTPCFGEVLRAIDEADREISRERNAVRLRGVKLII